MSTMFLLLSTYTADNIWVLTMVDRPTKCETTRIIIRSRRDAFPINITDVKSHSRSFHPRISDAWQLYKIIDIRNISISRLPNCKTMHPWCSLRWGSFDAVFYGLRINLTASSSSSSSSSNDDATDGGDDNDTIAVVDWHLQIQLSVEICFPGVRRSCD